MIQVIGSTYPSTRISTGSPGDALTLLIPDGERPERPGTPTGPPLADSAPRPVRALRLTPHELRLATEEELERAKAESTLLRTALAAMEDSD